MTELVTGLGMLGYDDVGAALEARPAAMVSVSPETWERLTAFWRGGALRGEFLAAWRNGQVFATARDGLRGRLPLLVEWKGGQRAPGDEVVPADLRIDHVYLVSCKYLSRIVVNASPAHLFDRLLRGGHGIRSTDWYREVAGDAYDALYREVVDDVGAPGLPPSVHACGPAERQLLGERLGRGRWPPHLRGAATRFAVAVADRSVQRWRDALGGSREQQEAMLWRLLRIGSAPYFVLGVSGRSTLRLRVMTPWDWRQRYRLRALELAAPPSEQPTVAWRATVADRRTAHEVVVEGHVEVRWSHGKFGAPPEAKVYLDTPHHRVPGYVPLA